MKAPKRTDTLKAIPCVFKGRQYRSRTEGRWAVFFAAAGIDAQYEAEAFDLDGVAYLPDFYIPAWRLFVEVKPDLEPLPEEIEKCQRLMQHSGRPVFMALGDPGHKRGIIFDPDARPGIGLRQAFLGLCRKCATPCMSWYSRDGETVSWGDWPLDKCLSDIHCSDRWTPFGNGFEAAIQTAVDFRWVG